MIAADKRQTVIGYWNESQTHSARICKLLNRLTHITDILYEVELVKPEKGHREQKFVGFFLRQYAKLRMLELDNNFFKSFCDFNEIEWIETGTVILNLALPAERLDDIIFPEEATSGIDYVLKVAGNISPGTQQTISSPEHAATHRGTTTKDNRVYLKKSLDGQRNCVFAAIHTVAFL